MLNRLIEQAKNPSGNVGSFMLRIMNNAHTQLNKWAFEKIKFKENSVVLDIGCGGGKTIQLLSSNEDFKTISLGFARKLIRTYYSMVMVRSQIWSTRLKEQSEVFIHHFPDKEPIICTLLNWLEEPSTDRETVYEFFKREGKWASDNFALEANISS